MRLFLRLWLPLLLLAGSGVTAWWFTRPGEPPESRPMRTAALQVEGVTLERTEFPVVVRTRGTVRPRTESTLVAEVAGRIVEVSPSFREGGFFEEGDMLLQLEPADYEAAVVMAEGELAQARATLLEEEARAAQAEENWRRLGRQGDPGPLVLREPQVAEATARLASAGAQLDRAKRDLERTIVRAPYAGRVLEKEVDVGQFVGSGTTLARVFAVDYVEVRLPLSNEQAGFVRLPEEFRDDDSPAVDRPEQGPAVRLRGRVGDRDASWQGHIVRVESAIDATTRQLFVIAQVDDPYARRADGSPPLKINMFVEAEIEGRVLENVVVVPRRAVRAGDEVIVIRDGRRIYRQDVRPVWRDRDFVVVSAGDDPGALPEGTVLCVTPIAYPTSGAPVIATIDGRPPADVANGSGRGGRPGPESAAGAAPAPAETPAAGVGEPSGEPGPEPRPGTAAARTGGEG